MSLIIIRAKLILGRMNGKKRQTFGFANIVNLARTKGLPFLTPPSISGCVMSLLANYLSKLPHILLHIEA